MRITQKNQFVNIFLRFFTLLLTETTNSTYNESSYVQIHYQGDVSMKLISCPFCNWRTDSPIPNCPRCKKDLAHSGVYLYNVAQYYEENGDPKTALRFYKLAAKENYTLAMTRLGEMYEMGIGTEAKLEFAVYSHQRAAENGAISSLRWLSRAYRGMRDPALTNLEKAKKYIKQLALLGDAESRSILDKLESIEGDSGDDEYMETSSDADNGAMAFGDDSEIHELDSIWGDVTAVAFPTRPRDSYTAIMVEEQQHLDSTIHKMETWVNDATLRIREGIDSPDYTSQASLECFYQEKHRLDSLREDIETVKNNIEQPYFAHLFFTNDETIDEKDVYVGNQEWVFDGRVSIISHNSPLGQVAHRRIDLYADTRSGRYTLQWRRMIAIRDRKIIKVVEDFNRSRGNNVVSYDEYLLTILNERRGETQLVDIVATIQDNQNYIVTRPVNQKMVVQGCAGSGKSMILLQRLQYLAYNRFCRLSDVTVLVPSERFRKHIDPLIGKLGLQSVGMMTVSEYYLSILRQYYKGKSDRIKTLSSKKIVDDSANLELAAHYYSAAFYRDALRDMESSKQKYQQEIKDYRVKEKEWEILREEAIIQNLDIPKKKSVCGNKPSMPTITRYLKTVSQKKKKDAVMKSELYAELLLCYMIAGEPPQNRDKFLFIDEAQDLAPSEYRLLYNLNGDSCIFNLFGDCQQTLSHSYGVRDWKEVAQMIGSFQQYSLNESYRNTWEITQFINQETGHNITPLGLHGENVTYVNSLQEFYTYAERFNRNNTAIIVKDDETVQKCAQNELWFRLQRKAQVYTVSEVKGLEFQTVLVWEEKMDLTEKYIAYSRARENLCLFRPQ